MTDGFKAVLEGLGYSTGAGAGATFALLLGKAILERVKRMLDDPPPKSLPAPDHCGGDWDRLWTDLQRIERSVERTSDRIAEALSQQADKTEEARLAIYRAANTVEAARLAIQSGVAPEKEKKP